MRVPDGCVAELREQGFVVVEGFLGADELAAAQDALWLHFPRPDEYFADPAAHASLTTSQWDGLITGPFRSWDLNRLAFHPDLLDFVERVLGSSDLHLYDAELWAKYAGGVDYDQRHHRDFGNHSLVVPKRSAAIGQMIAWILLSDVTAEDGPTKVVPLHLGTDVPYWPDSLDGSDDDFIRNYTPAAAFADDEVSVTGPAGTLVCFRTDVLHRGSNMTGARSSRFALLTDYERWGTRWQGRVGWPVQSLSAHWRELIERASPRERAVFGFPAPGDPYWDEQTLADTQARYPGADLSPYR